MLRSLDLIALSNRPLVEVFLVNDGSSDQSVCVMRRHCESASDFRWRVMDQANAGPSAARNAGLANTRSEWIQFLDADDELAADPIPSLVAAGNATSVGFAAEYRRHGRFGGSTRPPRLSAANWQRVLTAGCPFPISSVVFRRRCLENLFDETVRYTEDWLFWLQNPAIFRRMSIERAVTSSIIHIHDHNSSCNFSNWGVGRERASRAAFRFLEQTLSTTDRNNLELQARIGRLQQGQRLGATAFFKLPCDPLLYAKLWCYVLAQLFGLRASYYPQPKAPAGQEHHAGGGEPHSKSLAVVGNHDVDSLGS
jgi:glycosyltransferase involved in cell wall biosynthesis